MSPPPHPGLAPLFARRSIGRLTGPGPGPQDLRTMLEAAAAAPDHGELRPWRFVVLEGPAKDDFGEVLAEAYRRRAQEGGHGPEAARLEKERTKLGRAPLVVVVGAVRRPSDRIPWSDQLGSAHAAAQNLLLAATALGFGSMWRTGDVATDAHVKEALGLGPADAVVAFVYLGTPHPGGAREPRRPSLDGLVEHWAPPAGAVRR